MSGMTRQACHDKLDEIYDELEKLAERNGYPYVLSRVMLKAWEEENVLGCILVERAGGSWPDLPYITWHVSPYGDGLNWGHYDLDIHDAVADWVKRCC